MINIPFFSVSKGELPIEMTESFGRFLGKLLLRISELNWSGEWAFWEWFWVATLSATFAIIAFAVYQKTHAQ